MSSDIDVLIPEIREIKIADRVYHLQKISIFDGIKLLRFISDVLIKNQERFKAFQDRTKESSSNIQDMMVLVELLEQDEFYKLLGLILKEKDAEFLKCNLDFGSASEVVAIFSEINEGQIQQVKKNYERIAKVFQKEKQKATN